MVGFGERRLLRKEKKGKGTNFIHGKSWEYEKTKSLTHLFQTVSSTYCQCNTKCKNREIHTNKSTYKKHKDTTSLRKGTTDDISTNKFTAERSEYGE